jgi:DNA/RNA endonuclease YhcR with UshA esterase domain
LLVLLLAFCPQEDMIAPENASEHIDEEVTIKMVAESTRFIKDKDLCFLNSKKRHQDEDNFSVVIKAEGLRALAEKEIDDPAEHFKGKTIVVTGKVIKFKGKPQLEIKEADQIKIADEEEAEEEGEINDSESGGEHSTDSDDSSDGPIKPSKDG